MSVRAGVSVGLSCFRRVYFERFRPDRLVRLAPQRNHGEEDDKRDEEGESDPRDPCESLNSSSEGTKRSVAIRKTEKLI